MGDGGTRPPEFGVAGTIMPIVPSDFVMYKKERSVAFKISQAGGAHDGLKNP